MPRRPTTHSQLESLRQQGAVERVKARDLEAGLEAAKAKLVEASDAITAGYATDDQHAIARAHKTEEEAVAQVRELQHRLDGAALRIERARARND
jgi:multidrug resistance efflux pump